MDFYEALTGNSQDTSNPIATLGSALSAPPPQVEMPQRPQADTQMLPGLALLHMAAALSQRRQIGQSRTNQAISAVGDAGSYLMNQKALAEDRAAKRYSEDLAAAKLKSDITGQAIQQKGQQQRNVIEAVKAPYELANLEQAIKTARDEGELKNIQVKLGRVKDKYAEEMAQAELEASRAKTEDERAQAQNRGKIAEAAMRQAEAHMVTAKSQAERVSLENRIFEDGKRQGDFKVTQGLPGEQGDFVYKRKDGTVLTGKMPMDQAQAVKKAQADWKAMKDLLPKETDQNQWIVQHVKELTNPAAYQKAIEEQQGKMQNNVATTATPNGAPAQGAPSTAGSAPTSSEVEAMNYSKANPGVATFHKETGKYFIGGREVSKADAEARAQNKPTSAATAPSSSTSTSTKTKSGVNANEINAYQAEIDKIMAALNDPKTTTEDRIAASQKLDILARAKARLEDQAK